MSQPHHATGFAHRTVTEVPVGGGYGNVLLVYSGVAEFSPPESVDNVLQRLSFRIPLGGEAGSDLFSTTIESGALHLLPESAPSGTAAPALYSDLELDDRIFFGVEVVNVKLIPAESKKANPKLFVLDVIVNYRGGNARLLKLSYVASILVRSKMPELELSKLTFSPAKFVSQKGTPFLPQWIGTIFLSKAPLYPTRITLTWTPTPSMFLPVTLPSEVIVLPGDKRATFRMSALQHPQFSDGPTPIKYSVVVTANFVGETVNPQTGVAWGESQKAP